MVPGSEPGKRRGTIGSNAEPAMLQKVLRLPKFRVPGLGFGVGGRRRKQSNVSAMFSYSYHSILGEN